MRLSVDSIENLRTSLLTTLHACRLPKVFLKNHDFPTFESLGKLNRTVFQFNISTSSSVQSGSEWIRIRFVRSPRERSNQNMGQP